MDIIKWLLEGDPVIQYQTQRDLLNSSKETLKAIQQESLKSGWVKDYLDQQMENGHWGFRFYQPKWTSTHYTLLDLCLFNAPRTPGVQKAINLILEHEIGLDGGINPSRGIGESDVCINGMFLNYACYFRVDEEKLTGIVDYIIKQKMIDGGFNCRLNRSGAKHSSVHSTICMLEGIERYRQEGYTYRLKELVSLQRSSEEFLLEHRLYKSDKTGEVIHKNMTVFAYPFRWKYNVLRALDYFRWAGRPYDERMSDGIELILKKQKKDGKWSVQAKHPGRQHIVLEPSRQPSRMVTLMAMRVLKMYDKDWH